MDKLKQIELEYKGEARGLYPLDNGGIPEDIQLSSDMTVILENKIKNLKKNEIELKNKINKLEEINKELSSDNFKLSHENDAFKEEIRVLRNSLKMFDFTWKKPEPDFH